MFKKIIFFICNNITTHHVSLNKSIAMKILLSFLMVFVALAATAQQTKVYNDPNAKTRSISGSFKKISVSSGVELYLTQGNETALAVSVSDSKYEERFKTEVEDGVLKIYYDNKGVTWTNDKNRKLKAYLSVTRIEGLKASAGSKVVFSNQLSAENFDLSVSSGAILNGSLKVNVLNASVSSGALSTVSGTASSLTVTASSGAIFKGYDLKTENCTASANSGAVVNIEVQKQLNASANSGGVVSYKGNASVNKGTVHSGGAVRHQGS